MDYIQSIMPVMFKGVLVTLGVFFITLVASIPLGIISACLSVSNNKLLRKISGIYVWVMRGTPLLLQLIFIFFGLPILGVTFDRFTAAIIGFSLNYGAYFSEIFRAGIEGVENGQYEAASVLGLSPVITFMKITLPQVIKKVLPPVSNEVITLLKDTSLVYVLGIGELLRAAKLSANRDATLIPLIIAASIYLIITALLTKIFKKIEGRYAYYK